jgi:hypothetical protein
MVIENRARINEAEIAHMNLPLFPDIKQSDSIFDRRAKILREFASRIGEETPYDSSEFEYTSPIGEDARKILINGMTSLPEEGGNKLFRTSKNLDYISANEASHKALDRMYAGPVPENPDNLAWSRLFIENIHNAMAVRNRLRVIKNEFTNHMEEMFPKREGAIQVLSVAAGSSRAIMESIKYLNGKVNDRIALRMVDNSDEALADGRQLVKKLGIDGIAQFTKANFLPTTGYANADYRPEFIEVAGLFDYLKDSLIVRFLRELKPHMVDGGAVIYSNITLNDEYEFTHQVVGWRPMIYRTSQDLVRLAESAGFKSSNIRVVQEPLSVYNLAVATK